MHATLPKDQQKSTYINASFERYMLYDRPQDFLVLKQDAGEEGQMHSQQHTAFMLKGKTGSQVTRSTHGKDYGVML